MVKSFNTARLTNMELSEIQKSLKEADEKKIEKFREEFNPDDMGFAGRKEGV